MSRPLVNRRTGTSGPQETRNASMRGRFIRSNFQMKASTLASLPIPWASPRLKTRVIACQPQYNRERSIQITSLARGSRISKVASAKLPSLIHASPACASFIRVRKAGTSFLSQCGCQMASRQITGAPVRSPSFRAKVVFPLPAQPKITIRTMIVLLPSSVPDFKLSLHRCPARGRGLTHEDRLLGRQGSGAPQRCLCSVYPGCF
jgi:hypothetical protein